MCPFEFDIDDVKDRIINYPCNPQGYGRWLRMAIYHDDRVRRCSVCKKTDDDWFEDDYCPNCGAKMHQNFVPKEED